MVKQRKLLAIILAIVMVLSVAPATVNADSGSQTVSYMDASVNGTDARIGQYGTTNVKQYFFQGSDIETTNGGIATDEWPYSNDYGYTYDIKTKIPVTEYWDNYIIDKPDSTKDIKFGFFLGGSQTAQGSDNVMATKIVPKIKIVDKSGKTVLEGSEIYDGWKHQRLAAGGGSGSGPLRGFDVFLKIPADSLKPNTDYVLNFDEGMGASTLLDKKIVFNFTTSPIKVTNVKIDGEESNLKVGETKQLNAAVSPVNATFKDVSWVSSDPKIAKVDSKGKVKALKGGSVKITANTKDGIKAESTVNVIGTAKAKAKGNSYNSIKLTWNKVANADGYTVYKYNSKSKKYKAVKSTEKRSYIDKKEKTNKSKRYYVAAYKKVNGKKVYGKASAKVKAVPKMSIPEITLNSKSNRITSKVSKVSGAAGYDIWRSDSKNGKYNKLKTVKNERRVYISVNKDKGDVFYYKTRAFRIIDGKKVYSTYSKVKKIKVK